MNRIVVERQYSPPLSVAQLQSIVRDGASCLARHRVDYLGSLIGENGKRVTCVYAAPDAEAVSIANSQMGAEYERAWTARLYGSEAADPLSGETPSCIVVERTFPAPIAFEELEDKEGAHSWCLEAYRVTFMQSYFAIDRRRMMCLYLAPDAESVRRVQLTAGLPFERVWAAQVFRPNV